MESKKNEPSRVISLQPLTEATAKLEAMVAFANKKIYEHNELIRNRRTEAAQTTTEVWKYIVDVELGAELKVYYAKHDDLTKAETAITQQIKDTTKASREQLQGLTALEKRTSSILPTILHINALLRQCDFDSFSLARADDSLPLYRLVHEDGSDAKETLSEGEQSFVAFLYFYQLLKGSHSESGTSTKRIAVFDDPVSSLDSSVLFVVSCLIRELVKSVRDKRGIIKQVIVLTHNIYFHKEVTERGRYGKKQLKDTTYWVVRKAGGRSLVEKHEVNPINTSYALLWEEISRSNPSPTALQNSMRRILEYYFQHLGGSKHLDKLANRFTGVDAQVYSLIAWLHDGSHFAHDDLHFSPDPSLAERYLRVFETVFEDSGHGPHYRMMMGIPETEESVEPVLAKGATE